MEQFDAEGFLLLTCPRCTETKLAALFAPAKTRGRQRVCMACTSISNHKSIRNAYSPPSLERWGHNACVTRFGGTRPLFEKGSGRERT